MKTYYLIAEKSCGNLTTVRVSDGVGAGRTCLLAFEAESFAAASKMFSFSSTGCGKTAICGVDKAGKPYAKLVD